MLSRRGFLWRAGVIAAGGLTAPPLVFAAAAEVGFDDLYERETVLTEQLQKLAGEIVEMSGYMAPPLKAEASFFVLTRSPMAACPFCETEAVGRRTLFWCSPTTCWRRFRTMCGYGNREA